MYSDKGLENNVVDVGFESEFSVNEDTKAKEYCLWKIWFVRRLCKCLVGCGSALS